MPCGRPILLSKYGDDGLCGGFHRIVCELNSMNCRRIGMSAACHLQWAGDGKHPPRQPRRGRGASWLSPPLLSFLETNRITSGGARSLPSPPPPEYVFFPAFEKVGV